MKPLGLLCFIAKNSVSSEDSQQFRGAEIPNLPRSVHLGCDVRLAESAIENFLDGSNAGLLRLSVKGQASQFLDSLGSIGLRERLNVGRRLVRYADLPASVGWARLAFLE
jgi:hypothetical protein